MDFRRGSRRIPIKGEDLKFSHIHTYINFDVYGPMAVPNPHRRKTFALLFKFGGRPPAPPLFRLICNTFGISEFSISLFWGETPQALPLGLRTPFLIFVSFTPTISWVLHRRAAAGLAQGGAHSDWSRKFRSGVRLASVQNQTLCPCEWRDLEHSKSQTPPSPTSATAT
jgi:hypothetical protein